MPDVISGTLKFLQDQLNGNTAFVELANIATLNDGDDFLTSTHPVIMSVVNIREDRVMNNPNVYKQRADKQFDKVSNPIKNLNLYILFAAYSKNNSNTDNTYLSSITKLEQVIQFFQNQNVFERSNLPVTGNLPLGIDRIILDMESLKMEELNQIWSFLGNKYMPSVLYKMRVLSIQSDQLEGSSRVETVDVKLWNNDENDKIGLLESIENITKPE